MTIRFALAALASLALAGHGMAQWNPPAGQWGRSEAADLRVMTWNVQDAVCSTNPRKVEARNDWCAIARIIASMRPDALLIQEAGDNSGNGSGTGVDTVQQLEITVDLLLHGGTDPFNGNAPVTAWVQKYAPDYDLPHVFVSVNHDGFNRNIILSRYPLADLNGDGAAALSDIFLFADLYAPGGTGGIRGWGLAEIDLPDAVYAGDLVVGNSHLKSGGASGDLAQRLTASQNIAYYIDYLFNGAGTGTPDPRNKIRDNPPVTSILGEHTPLIWGGDWNEDELSNGRVGPAEWMTRAENAGGTDGTDRDRTDSTYDDARDLFTGSRATQSSSKLDYLAWQDAIATLRRSWIFNSATVGVAGLPPELVGYVGGGNSASSFASDHRPVLSDFLLPGAALAPGAFALVSPAPGAVNVPLEPTLTWEESAAASTYTLRVATDAGLTNLVLTLPDLTGTSVQVPPALLAVCETYHWGVAAVNSAGSTDSTPFSASFATLRPADFTGDGAISVADFLAFLGAYGTGDPRADFNADGTVNIADVLSFLTAYSEGC